MFVYNSYIIYPVRAHHNITVKPSNKQHIRDIINSHALSLVERSSLFGGSNCIATIEKHCREVYLYSVHVIFSELPLSGGGGGSLYVYVVLEYIPVCTATVTSDY